MTDERAAQAGEISTNGRQAVIVHLIEQFGPEESGTQQPGLSIARRSNDPDTSERHNSRPAGVAAPPTAGCQLARRASRSCSTPGRCGIPRAA
jgi:hypothetical protein